MSRGLDSPVRWLGIDIGGTNIKWALVCGPEVRATGSILTPRTGEQDVVACVARLINEHAGGIAGAGVTVPGHVDPSTGRTGIVPNLPGQWRGFPLGEALAQATGRQVAMLNDARAFALAELRLGAASDLRGAVFVVIGTGVGGAVMLDGVLLGGPAGRAGEVGHVSVVPDGPPCGCGARGCVDAVAGGAGLVAAASPLGAATRPERLTPADVFAAAADGDPLATGAVERGAGALANGVANVCALMGVSNVILGGGLSGLYPGLPDVIHRRLTMIAPLIGPALVRLSRFTDHSAAIGAALGAQMTHLEQP